MHFMYNINGLNNIFVHNVRNLHKKERIGELMSISKKLISIALCISMLMAVPYTAKADESYDPANGEFVFQSEDMLSYIKSPYSADVSYDSAENAMKMTVNGDHNGIDPQALLDMSSLSLNADDYGALLIIYRVPTETASSVLKTELFISAGSVTVPTAGKSVMYNVSKSNTYTSQIVDLSSLSWWSGDVHSIRIDFFTNAKVGDTMYIDSVILCSDQSSAIERRDARLSSLNAIDTPDYANTDYLCTKYEYDKYTSPIWKGDIVYNEAVYPIKDKNGNSTYTLMYEPDSIISVYTSDFSSLYYEGIDFTVEGNQITFLQSGNIRLKEYTYIHPQSNPYGYDWGTYYNRTAAGDGKWEYWGQSPEFYNGYINVTYTHSDSWSGYTPEKRADQVPLTSSTIANGGSMNIVFFGDSICGGANSSSYRDVYPYAEYWNEMIVSKLENDYGCNINATYSSVGGSTASGMVENLSSGVLRYSPDLVFIEFGANDAMNESQSSSGSMSKLKSAYKSAVIEMIDTTRRSFPQCEFVLVAPFYCNPFCHYMSYFEACRDALDEIAAAYSGVVVADVTAMQEDMLSYKDYLDFSGDNMCHPNDFMARIFAQVCLESIVPGGVDPYVVSEAPPVATPDTENYSAASPGGYGWQWPEAEAYGYINGYGRTGQDLEFSFDLCLLPVKSGYTEASFYTDGGNGIDITSADVTIEGESFPIEWGTMSEANWHRFTIKVLNGAGEVYMDGELVGKVDSGVTCYDSYILFFSQNGCMAIDNIKITNSSGRVFVDCDFEDEATAKDLMGDGLGAYTLLFANTVSYDLNGAESEALPNQIKVINKSLQLTEAIPQKAGATFLGWATDPTATKADYEAGAIYTADESCTLYAVWKEDKPLPPEVTSISPVNSTITDTGSVTITVTTIGENITYSWYCSNDALLPYISGADTASITITIPEKLSGDLSAYFNCTLTDSYGQKGMSTNATLEYTVTPDEPEEPALIRGDYNGDGSVNGADANLFKRLLSGELSVEEGSVQFTRIDLDGDGALTGKDANMLSRIISGAEA